MRPNTSLPACPFTVPPQVINLASSYADNIPRSRTARGASPLGRPTCTLWEVWYIRVRRLNSRFWVYRLRKSTEAGAADNSYAWVAELFWEIRAEVEGGFGCALEDAGGWC